MINNVLVVCTGNICRSPMAAELLRDMLDSRAGRDVSVESAGIHALVDHPADPYAQELMEHRGLPIDMHIARQINPGLLNWADIILVMERNQKTFIERKYPQTRGKVFRLGEWTSSEIHDPYRKNKEYFTRALSLIEDAAKTWVEKIINAS